MLNFADRSATQLACMSYYREQLEEWLSRIDVDAESVLDIGGGEKSIKDRIKSWNVKEYQILDNDAKFNPDFFFDLNYVIGSYEKIYACKFNVTFCLEVFEYIWDPVQAIKNIAELTRDIAYISFPSIYPVHAPAGIDYLRYTKFGVEKLLVEGGFATWEITPRVATNGIESLQKFYTLEGMHPLRNSSIIYEIGYLVKALK